MRRYIVVAGNMGVGKSTMVQFLTSHFGGKPFYEPINTNPYFSKFFGDMKTWGFHSQLYYLTHKFRLTLNLLKESGLLVLDRSIYEDAEIFAKGLHRARKMNNNDFQLYWDLYQGMCEVLTPPDLLIYLTCSMPVLKQRIAQRGRTSEKEVKASYLRRLQKNYDDWVDSVTFCKVLRINTDNIDYVSDLEHRIDIVTLISKHLKSC